MQTVIMGDFVVSKVITTAVAIFLVLATIAITIVLLTDGKKLFNKGVDSVTLITTKVEGSNYAEFNGGVFTGEQVIDVYKEYDTTEFGVFIFTNGSMYTDGNSGITARTLLAGENGHNILAYTGEEASLYAYTIGNHLVQPDGHTGELVVISDVSSKNYVNPDAVFISDLLTDTGDLDGKVCGIRFVQEE